MIIQGTVKHTRRAAFSSTAISCLAGVVQDDDGSLRVGFYAPGKIRERLKVPFAATLDGAAITVTRVQAVAAGGDPQGLTSYTLTVSQKDI